jgi:Lrp/AsnC family transcriptional regulator for asnA, asnC and gidA
MGGLTTMREVDELDLEIIRILEEDGRASFTRIAEKLKSKESTVRKRVIALQKRGVIKKFSVVIDPAKIGLNTMAIVGMDVDPPMLLEAAQKLCEVPEIRCVATSSGDHMIMTEMWTTDGRTLAKLLSKKIGAIEGVQKVCPAIILEKLKG